MSDMGVMLATTGHEVRVSRKATVAGKSCLWFIRPAYNQAQILR
jgi:hypothetical protein